ncbi:MAG: type IX secretion system protein PorQ [Bacteroidetes bacterium]|nr:MAG: type IX secretion system protein PorQ [Bacteroidota bacterium]
MNTLNTLLHRLDAMRLLLVFFLFSSPIIGFSQTGGENYFPFLNLDYNARTAALGGDFITVKDADINLGVLTPSLLNDNMAKTIGFNQALLAGGINYGMVSYGYNIKNVGMFGSYIKYVNYGKFKRTAINGTAEGEFNPFEMVIGTAYSKQLNPRISVGSSFNLIYSQIESYNAFGAYADLSGTYTSEKEDLTVTAKAKNIGIAFDRYYKEGSRAPLPADLQLGLSYKLEHAPFRFSLLAHDLNRWDLTYKDPNTGPTIDPLTGDTTNLNQPGFLEKLARHFTVQTELLIGKHIHLRTAFDFQRRKELQLESRPGAAGLSFGIGLYFRKFSLDYGYVIYSKAGYGHLFTLSTPLGEWRK